MSKQERNILDDLAEIGRELIQQIDEALNPEKKRKPARVPVPIPVHPENRQPNRNDQNPYSSY